MPRQIRFRVWNPTEKTMICPEPASLTCVIGLDGHVFNAEELTPLDGAILMLSTGLKDKNGREIFEGDLLRFPDCDDEWIQAVEWSEYSAEFPLFYDDRDFGQFCNPKNAAVIGNIYENSDVEEGMVEKEPEQPKPHVPEINLPWQGLY